MSIHGVPRILKTDKPIVKLIWTVMILISASFGLSIISSSVNDYYAFNVITNIETVTPDYVVFPAITMCINRQYETRHYINNTLVRTESTKIDIKQLLKESFFNTEKLTSANLDFFQIVTPYDSCVRFNGFLNESIQLKKVGGFFGRVIFTFDYHFTEIISDIEKIDYIKFDKDVLIFVTDNHLNSFMKNYPLVYDMNKNYHINVYKDTAELKLGEPYNHCDDTVDVTYRQSNCVEECIDRETKKQLNCSFQSFYKHNDLDLCGSWDLVENNTVEKDWLPTGDVDSYFEFYKFCKNECPTECESVHFSSLSFDIGIKDKTRSLVFSVSDFSTLKITQIPKMNQYTLLSSIGGSLGLFIGIRFLSLVEVFEFFIELVYVICAEHFSF